MVDTIALFALVYVLMTGIQILTSLRIITILHEIENELIAIKSKMELEKKA
jgi:hypothetical protein